MPRISFDSPAYLALLALLPVLWWFGYRTLSGLGNVRRAIALSLRSIVLLLVILALAEMQIVRTSDRLTVLYLLDQSLSIPEAQRRDMIRFVNESITEHRDPDRFDRAGVIVFGRDAAVEIPPIDEDVPVSMSIESLLDREHTDLAGAMKMALALFPHDAAKRVVLVSDGNENLGDAHSQAQALVDAGVSIDVVPIRLEARGEVAVEKLAVSTDVRRGQPFDMRVVLNNTTEPRPGSSGVIRGKLKILRRASQIEETLLETDVALPPGKTVKTFRQQIDQPDFYTYEARFTPDRPADDALSQNNRATTFTYVRGKGQVLLIEDWEYKGEFEHLIESLKNQDLEVTVQASDRLFTSLSELQRYDTVLLANVPRSSGDDADLVTNFSDEQVEMLVRNTQQMGAGLVMLGGPNAFGAGGWANTKLEEAMPIDFTVKSAKVVPVGALVLIMHAGEMDRGNFWQRVVAREAIKALGNQDYCGLVHWQGTEQWLWGRPEGVKRVGPLRKTMLARLDQMTPGDMPAFDPSMQMAAAALGKLPDAAIKHAIIISDGDPSPPNWNTTIPRLVKLGVKVSTVAVGSHGTLGSGVMQQIASATGGKYYVVKQANALPRIYQREARRVARPLVYEDPTGMTPRIEYPHEMIKGLNSLPPFTGYVLSTVKDSPLVEVALTAPKPETKENATLLASWNYGAGKSVALTTDAGHRWATSWTGWDQYEQIFSQIVRWSMRPVADTGKFTVATDVEDGRGKIIITALDQEDNYLDFLNMNGDVVGPDNQPISLKVQQTAPGRYVGEFDAEAAGSYFVRISPGPDRAPIRTGVNIPYSDEFRDSESNVGLLKTIASLKPKGGKLGMVYEHEAGDVESLLEFNPFRFDLPRSTASRDVWHLLLLAMAILFFLDVFNRRVQVSFAWLPPLVAKLRDRILGRPAEAAPNETMSRLRSRKAEVDQSIEDRRAAARFEPQPDAPVDESALQEAGASSGPPQRPEKKLPKQLEPEAQEETYTERLLKAKKKVWDEKNR